MILSLALSLASSALPLGDLEPVCIGDTAPHNAFTDIARAGGRLFCVYRESDSHALGSDGKIRVLVQQRDSSWESFALIEEPSVDLRDPKLSVTPRGELMLLCGGSHYVDRELVKRRNLVALLKPRADTFGPLQVVEIDEAIRTKVDWLWRVTWHRDLGYGVVYQAIEGASGVRLVSTRDGLHYDHVSTFPITGEPNEVSLRFGKKGQMTALIRRDGEDMAAYFGSARAPYTEWSFKELPEQMGGPNLVQLPGGEWLAAYRRYRPNGQRTALALIDLNGSLQQLAVLPSGGDTSYPGLLVEKDRLLISYYSGHEGQTNVYFLDLEIGALLGAR